MSAFGDSREHMNTWLDFLDERAEEVGVNQAVREYADVLVYFMEYYAPQIKTKDAP